jgi:GH35 family endo-1,4-beta-xylanase
MTYTPKPYNISGVVLWGVEDGNGWIERYCDTKEDAENRSKELNENQKRTGNTLVKM